MSLINQKKFALPVLLFAVLAVYSGSLRSGFVWDDKFLIVQKAAFFRAPGSAIKIISSSDTPFGSKEKNPYWRPANTLSYMLDDRLWGVNPFWYHLENVLLHGLAVALFYLLVDSVFGDGTLAFISALLFAVYPVNVEAVGFISARNNLFCADFVLLSMLFLIRRGKYSWVAALIFYFLALLNKEPAVVLPFFLLSLALIARRERPENKNPRPSWAALAGYFAVLGVYFVLRRLVLGVFTSQEGIVLSAERLKFVASVFFENFRLMVYPFKLNAFYTKKYVEGLGALPAVLGAFGAVLLSYLAWRPKGPGPVRAGALWMLWGLLPISNIVAIPSAPVAERYQYLPLFGFLLIIGHLLGPLFRRKALLGRAALAGLVLTLGGRSFQRDRVWRDDISLFESMVRADPRNADAHCWLGAAYQTGNNLEAAVDELRTAIRLDPDIAEAHVNLGLAYGAMNDSAGEMAEYKTAERLKPDLIEAHLDLGVAYARQNRPDEAIWEFQTAARLAPDNAQAYYNLGLAYAGKGQLYPALEAFSRAAQLAPGNSMAHNNLGVTYEQLGRAGDAVAEFQTALKIDPANTKAMENLERLAGH
ncbi:MAG: tetratricopeptide repeat protein [Nitrospiraceae bacterium]|nr:tetratricopeptide repeat protein [Nitrospiraceae bacterium]